MPADSLDLDIRTQILADLSKIASRAFRDMTLAGGPQACPRSAPLISILCVVIGAGEAGGVDLTELRAATNVAARRFLARHGNEWHADA